MWPLLPVGAFLGWRLIEAFMHRRWLQAVPLRIHVNGTRGKSQTVELITRGFQACGLRAVGKVTGVVPALIAPDGRRLRLRRLGPGSIGEQMRVLRYVARLKANALVIECNAIEPQLQRASQELILQAQISIVTNVRQDHTDVLGCCEQDAARALGSVIPRGGTLVTGEERHLDLLRQLAADKQARCVRAPTPCVEALTADCSVPSWIRRDNLALALTACETVGVDLPAALNAMLSAAPPRASRLLWRLQQGGRTVFFLNAFSANDPQSTEQLIEEGTRQLGQDTPLVVVFNHRQDRAFRVDTFMPLFQDPRVEQLFLIGQRVPRWRAKLPQAESLAGRHSPELVLQRVLASARSHTLVVGVGNIGGAGLKLVDLLERVGEEI